MTSNGDMLKAAVHLIEEVSHCRACPSCQDAAKQFLELYRLVQELPEPAKGDPDAREG
jgi:predicted anti-sigma-YlaC factor YlaD